MATKTLFLDFDGVLHHEYAADELFKVDSILADPDCFGYADILAGLLEGRDVQIVVHSNWRLGDQYTLDQLRQFIKTLGSRFVGITPIPEDWETYTEWRYNSIQKYVAEHGITDYRILDDARDEFPPDLPELILCDHIRGVDDDEVQEKIKEWLAS